MVGLPVIHVLGAGSIGMLTAWHLRHAQLPVTLLLRRPASAELLTAAGNKIQLEYAGMPAAAAPDWLRSCAPLPAWDVGVELLQERASGVSGSSTSGRPAGSPPEQICRLIVATKAGDTVPALLSVLRRLSPGCHVLLLQNGIQGVYQELYEKVLSLPGAPPSMNLLVGSVTHGAFLRSPSHVVHSGMGSIKLAPLDSRLPHLMHPQHQQAWEQCSRRPPARDPPDPSDAQRPNDSNSPRGGTGSLPAAGPPPPGPPHPWDQGHGSARGLLQLLLRVPSLATELVPDHRSLMRQVHLKLAVNCAVNPGTALLGCLNSSYSEEPWGRALVLSVCGELFGLYGPELLGVGSGAELAEHVLQVASGTGKNKNSMLQDVLGGRPTEVDYLNGYVARWAQQQGRPAPVNALLHQLIKAKERLGRGLS